jgi:hypothetical protein
LSGDESIPPAEAVQHDRLRVLLVIARPGGVHDVRYRSIGAPLLASVAGCADVVFLRPPTLDALAAHLTDARSAGDPYTVVHFDVHGELADQGTVVLERPRGGVHRVPAAEVARVLANVGVPVVVLNACESGAVARAIDTAVATRLVTEGVPAVVAMGYRMLVDAAADFTAAFYGHLVRGGDVTSAVGAARARLHAAGSGQWLVPVYYRRHENRFVRTWGRRQAVAAASGQDAPVGRDDAILTLERATQRDRVVLLHGMAGIGKTTVARMFADWWGCTGGADRTRRFRRPHAGAGGRARQRAVRRRCRSGSGRASRPARVGWLRRGSIFAGSSTWIRLVRR